MVSLAAVNGVRVRSTEGRVIDLAAEAGRRVRECERRIEEQRAHIHQLALTGCSTTQACFDLHRMHLLLAVLTETRGRLADRSRGGDASAAHRPRERQPAGVLARLLAARAAEER